MLYPILHRMLDEHWLADGWEQSVKTDGRPPRRYYELTPEGVKHFREELAAVQTDVRFRAILGTAG